MAFTPLNATHPITSFTFAGAATKNLGVDILGLADPTSVGAGNAGQCVWFGIQNQTGEDILILSTVGGTKGILVKDGDLYRTPNENGYDVFEYWVKSSGAGDVVVERKIG
jgi:hypothetical protein